MFCLSFGVVAAWVALDQQAFLWFWRRGTEQSYEARAAVLGGSRIPLERRQRRVRLALGAGAAAFIAIGVLGVVTQLAS